MQIVRTDNTNPFFNAALEAYLYRHRPENTSIAIIYRNERSVMIGRNQNPWQETSLDARCRRALPVVRRLSGGGAVYHDLGNVNCAFIVPRNFYSPDLHVEVIISALTSLGLEAETRGQHGIWSGGRKLSGNAFALNSKNALLHGCILVDTDLRELSSALREAPSYSFQGASIPSVRAPVTNVSSLLPGTTPTDVEDALAAEIARRWPRTSAEQFSLPDATGTPDFRQTLTEFSDDAWNLNHTPKFTMRIRRAEGTLQLVVEAGIVCSAFMSAANLADVAIPEYVGHPLDALLVSLIHP